MRAIVLILQKVKMRVWLKIGLYILEVLVGIAMELCSRKGTRKSCFLFSMIEVLESGIHLLVLST